MRKRDLIRSSRRLTESDCRQTVLQALRGLRWAIPVEHKFRKGLQDIYVDGGIWIECKFKVLTARGRGYNLLNEFTNAQKRTALRGGQDQALAAFLLCSPKGESYFFICRFAELYSDSERRDKCLWTVKKAREWGVPLDDAEDYVRAVILDMWQGVQRHLAFDPEMTGKRILELSNIRGNEEEWLQIMEGLSAGPGGSEFGE